MSDEPDLDLVATDDLIDALKRRSDGMVLAICLKSDSPQEPPVKLAFGGSRLTSRGLCEDLVDHIRDQSKRAFTPDDE